MQVLVIGLLGALERCGTARGLVLGLRQHGGAGRDEADAKEGKEGVAHNHFLSRTKPAANGKRPATLWVHPAPIKAAGGDAGRLSPPLP